MSSFSNQLSGARIDDAVVVFRNHTCVCFFERLFHSIKNRIADFLVTEQRAFVVDPDDLLLAGVRLASEDSHLSCRLNILRNNDSRDIDPCRFEFRTQLTPRLIITSHRNQRNACAKRKEIHRTICRTTRQCLCLLVSQNKNGRFARDAADRSVHKLIRNRVAEDHDSLFTEPLDNANQFILQQSPSRLPKDFRRRHPAAASTHYVDIPTHHAHTHSKQTPNVNQHFARVRHHYNDHQPSSSLPDRSQNPSPHNRSTRSSACDNHNQSGTAARRLTDGARSSRSR